LVLPAYDQHQLALDFFLHVERLADSVLAALALDRFAWTKSSPYVKMTGGNW
jgi:hypothetical protein